MNINIRPDSPPITYWPVQLVDFGQESTELTYTSANFLSGANFSGFSRSHRELMLVIQIITSYGTGEFLPSELLRRSPTHQNYKLDFILRREAD